VRDIAQPQTGVRQQSADRMRRKRRAVFLTLAETLFRHRANELAVDHQTGGRIGVEGVESEDDGHGSPWGSSQ
jgi:hypothetical protein